MNKGIIVKHFVIEIVYNSVPPDDVLKEHREYLKIGYQKQLLLMSGPQIPRVGGMVIARAESLSEIQEFFDIDPYNVQGYAKYRIIEFNPVSHQEFLDNWLKD